MTCTLCDEGEKTGILVTVEQASKSLCLGPAISAQCHKRFFDYFDAPAVNITALDIPAPVSKVLEAAAVPSVEQVPPRLYRQLTGKNR